MYFSKRHHQGAVFGPWRQQVPNISVLWTSFAVLTRCTVPVVLVDIGTSSCGNVSFTRLDLQPQHDSNISTTKLRIDNHIFRSCKTPEKSGASAQPLSVWRRAPFPSRSSYRASTIQVISTAPRCCRTYPHRCACLKYIQWGALSPLWSNSSRARLGTAWRRADKES